MRIAPDGVPEWGRVYEAVLAERAEWLEGWDLGRGSLNDLVAPLADRLPMTQAEVVRHLRIVWGRITWFPDSKAWVNQLAGKVPQAVVTVNPHEFSGIARACGLDVRIPVIVTSAELGTLSKLAMAERARCILGLRPGLSTTVLVDNKQANLDEFTVGGGQAILYEQQSTCLDTLATLILT